MTQPTADTVLILGMHRSGTSAVTRVVNLLGVQLGDDLLPPAADNESGFWEDRAIQFLHDRIYEDLGREWTQVSPLPDHWPDRPAVKARQQQLRESLHRFNGQPLWGVKDPRLAAMIPVWRPVLDENGCRPKAVLIFRNPAEVAKSLAKRDGFASSRSHLLWLRSLVDCVRNTEGMPRSMTTYERILADWRGETARLGGQLGITWPAGDTAASEIDQFLTPVSRHQVVDDAAFLAEDSVPPLLRDAYADVLEAAKTGDVSALIATADKIAAALDSTRAALGPFVEDLETYYRDTVIAWNVIELDLHGRIGAEQFRAISEADRAGRAEAAAREAEARAGAESQRAAGAESRFAAEQTRAIAAETKSAADEAAAALLRDQLAEAGRRTAEDQERLRAAASASAADQAELAKIAAQLVAARETLTTQSGRLKNAQKETILTGNLLAGTRNELSMAYLSRDTLGASLHRLFRSRLWRWSRPWFWIARALGMLKIDAGTLVPLTPAKRGGDGCWRGTIQPMFLVPTTPLIGWVRLRARVRASIPSRAYLYLDSGSGFHPQNGIELAPVAGVTEIDRSIAIRTTTYLLRFDPVQAPGEFSLESFSLEPMSPIGFNLSAAWRNFRRIATGTGAHRPSVWLGIKLVLTGKWRVFHQQLVSNVESTTAVSEYDLWQKAAELTELKRQQMQDELASWQNPPVISVIVPVYNVEEKYLRPCLDSVLRQTYPHWELCVADDASPSPHVRAILDDYAAKDPRVKVVHRPVNGNISAASNSALEVATGSYIALLDHDDELAEHALHAMAAAIMADPSRDMIYSDEDKMTPAGKRLDPFFKPDWSPEYFLACMYTCHLGVYRTSLVRNIGGWRSAFDSAQDYDLVLRIVGAGAKIHHIPDVLYHWRTIPQSTAANSGAKPEAYDRARAALLEHINATGRPGRVMPGPSEGFHRVRFDIKGTPRVSVLIPSACRQIEISGRRTWLALECVSSIRRLSTYPDIEIILSDNANMSPELADALEPYNVRVEPFTEPFNFSRKMNAAAAVSTGDHLILLNDDTEVISPDWVESMLEFSQQPEIGAVGAQLLFPNDTQQHNGVNVLDGNPGHPFYGSPADHPGYFFSSAVHRNWSAVTGACLMTRKDVYNEVGGFSEDFPLNYNDVDYCLKVTETGRRVVHVPYAKLYHHESVSKVGTDIAELNAFKERWAAKIPRDPYYNPNLTLQTSDFRIRVPG
jgi:GT2 family glycosyltransferase